MPVKTSRSIENSDVSIDYSVCTHCGLCVQVCKNLSLIFVDGEVKKGTDPVFGCVGCGQCVAVCPLDCISIKGREISTEDFNILPSRNNRAEYDSLYALMYSRRSVRDFKDKEISDDEIKKILDASVTSPMGIPPSDVSVIVLKGRDKVKAFSDDMINYFRKMRNYFKPGIMWIFRPFMNRNDYDAIKSFINPLMNALIKKQDEGEDWLLYNAPLAIYFYNSPYADPADAYIAATYSTLAAESLGLGSCMIGSINPFLIKGGKKIKQKYGIDVEGKQGIMVIYGYPKFKYKKGIRRSFRSVNYN